MRHHSDQDQEPTENDVFVPVILGTLLIGFVAVALSLLLKTPLPAQFSLNANDFLVGVIATLPLALFLYWFSNTTNETLAAFRHSQIAFFASLGFEFTLPRIILMALAAGISEELLFRGVLQTWLANYTPLIAAIVISNVIFGALHMRTMLYALIAGLVGVYLGIVYAATDNLLAPIVTHIVYDAIALEYTRRAIANTNLQKH